MKNLFGTQIYLLSVRWIFTSLIDKIDPPVIKTQLFLKPPNVDENRLAPYHTFNTRETVFEFEKCVRGRLTLIHFSLSCHYKLTVVTICLLLTGINFWIPTNNLWLIIVNHGWYHIVFIKYLWYSSEAWYFGHKWGDTVWNFIKTESFRPRKTSWNTVNFH